MHNMEKWFTMVLLDPTRWFFCTGNDKASIVMGDVAVECNPTEGSVVVVMLLVDSPKFRRSRTIEQNPIQLQPSGNVHLMLLWRWFHKFYHGNWSCTFVISFFICYLLLNRRFSWDKFRMHVFNVLIRIVKCTTLHEIFPRMGISWFSIQTATTWNTDTLIL